MLQNGIFVEILIIVTCFRNCSAFSEREDLIHQYFNRNYSYAEIVLVLNFSHGIYLSIRHLKRLLKQLNLNRRITWTPLDVVFKALNEELVGSGRHLGYKFMWHRLKVKYNIQVKRDVVLSMTRFIDSQGVERRRARRFFRRQYHCPGPNFVWHLDGYDKLKPFGFTIHGCIDGYSRRLMWLEVGNTNNDPSAIAQYYLECVETLGYASQLIRCDLGTENSSIKHLHPFIVNNPSAAVIFGRSTSNQRIEAWWSILRKSVTTWWINFFKDLREMNLYNDSDDIHVECLKYCFMEVIQGELQSFKDQWNCHRLRKQRNSELPAGNSDIMHFAPQVYGPNHMHFQFIKMMLIVAEVFLVNPVQS
jgi:hypothetical protein